MYRYCSLVLAHITVSTKNRYKYRRHLCTCWYCTSSSTVHADPHVLSVPRPFKINFSGCHRARLLLLFPTKNNNSSVLTGPCMFARTHTPQICDTSQTGKQIHVHARDSFVIQYSVISNLLGKVFCSSKHRVTPRASPDRKEGIHHLFTLWS
jgi:hypothetical protein